MKNINGYWVDENNNNKWNSNLYSEKQAKKLSETLINCSDCIDCSNCSYCSDCIDCCDSSYCVSCFSCSYCVSCSYCKNCCVCSYCKNCSNCSSCSYCKNCRYIKEDAERYVSSRLGSRNDHTFFYKRHSGIWVVCGCFEGDLEEFEVEVKATYKKENQYYIDYMNLIDKVKKIFELEKGLN